MTSDKQERKTGLYSFEDVDGVKWYAIGASEVCGPEYVDFQNADGSQKTVRRKTDVLAYGLHIPVKGIPLVRQEMDAPNDAAKDVADDEANDVADELGLMTAKEREIMEELGL